MLARQHGKAAAAQVKIGAVEFSEVENSTTAATRQTNAKYYHAFSNGACYEFALGLGTETDGSAKGIKPVDRQEVFAKLEKILATVKLQPAAAPETETATPSAKTVAPDASSITTNGTTNTPNGGSNTPEQSTSTAITSCGFFPRSRTGLPDSSPVPVFF